MFDLLTQAELRHADDAAVRAAIEHAAKVETMAAAAKHDAVAELVRRNTVDEPDDEGLWVIDGWEAVAAEVGSAMGVTSRRASKLMYLARDLDERLPKVAAQFRAGNLSERIVRLIAFRTHLVSGAALTLIDTEIATATREWGTPSDAEMQRIIDAIVARHDPTGTVQFTAAKRTMDVQFGKPDDDTGTTSVFGRIFATTGALLEKQITTLLQGVCPDDPRPVGQRRAEALDVIAAGGSRLACQCGRPECPNSDPNTHHRGKTVIHVLAEVAAFDPEGDSPGAAMLLGGAMVPAALLAELLRSGATLKPLVPPCSDSGPEPRYRPSAKLDRWVRLRDMTCRFPGCNTPADHCDIDHRVPHPKGATHPSNLRCLCRKHHLLRTFW